ncbi:Protein kinase family protein [Melia azedarach]|uniref:Protein kinase family protein n=1 Tax=Melia azedarach TaxID=155640 RepID=A0ACC1XKN8_MELAZ|nr:Protein kinase family protein [Melia azedarach]
MEQFRQVGEVLGSLNALMVLKDDIQINQRQCCLLLDMFSLAFSNVADAIRLLLRSEEKNTKWKALEQPLRELHKVFKEGEHYVKQCLDNKDWWSKAISLHQNKDCVEFHIHNLLCYFPAVIEAIETAGEISGLDPDEMQRRRVALGRKYDKEWNDPKLFQLKFGKEYLISREVCGRFESAWKEDKWLLSEALKEKRRLGSVVLTKNEQRLVDMLLKKINGSEPGNGKLFPSSILLGGKDYQVRRRLGGGSQYKEIQWLGDSFVVRHFYGELESLNPEISTILSLSHPNIVQHLCGFSDEEKKEYFLVMELMSKDLSCYMRETFGSRRRISFSLPVVVDLMLQIARGMEFLHSQKIYHGELNPSNIFLKARSIEGYFHVKVSGFGLHSIKTYSSRKSSENPPAPPPPPNQNPTNPFIWYAPEVLTEREGQGNRSTSRFSEKADVYSFGMLCFELLTGKVPFEDGHLQGDKTAKNIRAGERPLFPSGSPKYLVNLTKKCWHTSPSQRPSFSSICRILRYIKKFMATNPDIAQSEYQSPLADYCDIEAGFARKFSGEGSPDVSSLTQIPFQMFAYKIAEKEKANSSSKGKWEFSSDATSICKDESLSLCDDAMMPVADTRSVSSDVKSVSFDMRSAYSEAPGKRLSNIDMRSVCSDAANKKMHSNVMRLVQSMVPENSISSYEKRSAVREKNISSSATKSVTSEKNVSTDDDSKSVVPEKSVSNSDDTKSEVPEKNVSPDDDTKSEVPEKNVSPGDDSKSEVPEKNVSTSDTKSVSSDTPAAPDKKIPDSDTRSFCSKISEKKPIVIKKFPSVKVKKGPGTTKARMARPAPKPRSTRTSTPQSPRPSPKSPPFIPSGRSIKTSQEGMNLKSPSRRRSSVQVSNSEGA